MNVPTSIGGAARGGTVLGGRLGGHLRLTRPLQASAVAAGTWIGSRLAGIDDAVAVAWMALSTAALFGASTTFNDCCNVAEDARNRPLRPLIAGTVSRKHALAQAFALFGVGIGGGFVVDMRMGIGACAVTGLSVLYSLRLKGVVLVGNVVVASVSCFSVGCWLILVGDAIPEYYQVCIVLWLIRMGGELAKVAEDVNGDRLAGLTTLATRCGRVFAHRVALVFLTVAISLASLVLAASVLSALFLGTCGALVALGWWLSRRPDDATLILIERAVTVMFMVGVATEFVTLAGPLG